MTVWTAINLANNVIFGFWFGLFTGLPDWFQILLTSLPITILALLAFRYVSNQAEIHIAKERIKGYLLELWLYKDDLGVMLTAQGRVFLYSLRYMSLALVPMAVLLIPVGLIIVQLESQFAFQALMPGQKALFTVTVDADTPVSQLDVGLSLPESITLDSPVLRIDQKRQLLWRLQVNAPGAHEIIFNIGDRQLQRIVRVGTEVDSLWSHAYSAGDWRVLGSAAEPPLPVDAKGISTEISYARDRGVFFGLSSASWLLLLFTLILGFMLRGFFDVTF